MPRRGKKRKTRAKRVPINPFLPKPFLKGSKKDLVCYLPPGIVRGGGGIIKGPADQWDTDPKKTRDTELCNRIWKETKATVRACWYDVGSSALDKDGVRRPHMMIRPLYDYAKSMKFERLHLVGYSGGAMLGSSQLVFHPSRPGDPPVATLVLIAPIVAEGLDKAHRNAAFFADRINARTRLIWGSDDPKAKLGAQVWKEHNMNTDTQEYTGEHNFCRSGQFEKVARMVTEWLPKAADLKRRKTRRVRRRKQARK